MAANRFGIDLGDIYARSENVKSQRINNELARMKMDAYTQNREDQRSEKERATQRNALMVPIRQQAAEGNEDARARLMALDPENGPAFVEKLGKIDKKELENLQQSFEIIGSNAAAILREQDPEVQLSMYQDWYNGAPKALRARMPKTNVRKFLEKSLAQVTAMDELTSEVKSVRFGGEDILYKGNREIGRATRPISSKSGKAGDSSVSDTEIKTMGKLITQAYGGKFVRTPEGDLVFTGLDDTQNRKAMAALTRAVELRNEMGPGSQAKASQMAMEEFGTEFPSPGRPDAKKPKGRYKLENGQKFELQRDGSWKAI